MLSRTRAFLRNALAQAKTGRAPRTPRLSRKLGVETLEGRRLLAATDLAAITGVVYFDVTANGYDAGEEIELADVLLYRDSGNNVLDAADGSAIESTVTDSQGVYRFDGLSAGTYFVQQPGQTADGKTLDEAVSTPIVITSADAAGTPGVVLDSFNTTQQDVSALSSGGNNPDHKAKQVATGEALGGERDLYALLTAGTGRISLEAVAFGMPVLQFDSTSGVAGRRVVTWDGPDGDAMSLDYTGLNSKDLTDDGNNVGFQLAIGADQNNGKVEIRVYTDQNNWSVGEVSIPNTGGLAGDEVLIRFSDFQQGAGANGPANMRDVGAVELEILGTALSVNGQIDLIGALGHTEFTRNFANSRVADLWLTKTVDDSTPNLNDNVTFTITVTNDGPDNATDVAVSDTLPAGMTYVSSNDSRGGYNNATGTWTVGALDVGTSATLQITASVDTEGTKTNIAQVSAANAFDPDSTPANNKPAEDDQDSASVIPQVIDLWLTKTVNDSTPNIGDQVVFTVTLTNDGPKTATGVAVHDVLPAGLSLVSSNTDRGSYDSATGEWTVGTLATGGDATLWLTASVDTTGTKINQAEVSAADQYDIDSTPNNHVPNEDDQDLASLTPRVADLELTKTVNDATPNLGAAVTFTVTVDNKGPDAATGVAIADVLPAGLTFVRADASQGAYLQGSGVWTVGNLAVGGRATLDLTVTVDTMGQKTNTAQVSAAREFDIDSTPNNNIPSEDDQDAASVTPQAADLSLSKTVNNPTPNLGDVVKFTVTVENEGPSTAHNVTVRDVLPPGLTYVSFAGRGSYDPVSGIWNVGTVTVGQTPMMKIQARVVSRQTHVNLAQVQTADEFDIDSTPGNNVPTEDDQDTASVVVEIADLSLTKTVDNSAPNVGDSVTFTITLSNAGPDTATGIAVDDVLPPGLTFQSARPTRGLYDSATGVWRIGSLAANDSLTLLVTARVDEGGTHTNVAQVSDVRQYDPDSTPGNNIPSEDDQDAAELTPPATVAGYVYLDKNGNGQRDAGEPGIGGVDVELTGNDHQGNPVNRMTTTAASGLYRFGNLPPSDAAGYQIIELQPDDYLDGHETVGSLGGELPPPVLVPQNNQLVPMAIGDHIQEIVVKSGDNGILYNFGEVQTSSISGRVYYDANKDGVKQGNETGIGGVQLVLTGMDDLGNSVRLTTRTNASGGYRFANLRPAGASGYTITETQPTGFDDGQERVGTPPLTSQSPTLRTLDTAFSTLAVNDAFSNLALPSGVDAVRFDFGEVINLITKRRYLSTW